MKLSSTLNLNPNSFQSKFKFTLSILNSFSFSSLSNHGTTQFNRNFNNNAIDRILLRFRTLSELSNHHHDEPTRTLPPHQFLHRQWLRSDDAIFPSENNEEKVFKKKKKKNEVMARCLAEEELNRLRTIGMNLKEKISIPKSGLTRPVLHKIHHQWNNSELVKLKFHEFLSQNMKLAHDIVQVYAAGFVTDWF
ncbi:uncharacterized protein LOC131631056 [Vicia villosa]|uniref:uncharacterized protein LOC131631056 n=1 Tax=Vicia villosa TaxID=3911 RepID=UPI00273BA3E2|nr:uncharacterized protein LOC131631056 [Vicia villosa]